MTVVARSLDDLDRLAFRLSRTVRTQYPQLLTQGFTLTDLEERLLPYREVRREMADGGADAFEAALLRLVSGERGYLIAEAELREACLQALAFPSPTLALVRTWATSPLQLARAASNTPAATVRTDGGPGGGAANLDVFPPPSVRISSAPSAPVGQPRSGRPAVGSPSATTAHVACRFCSGRLPDQRRVTFCPHCGMDQTKRQCAACSTELEAHWRFCVTCGRSDG